MTYYNTNGLTGEELARAKYKAGSQAYKIYVVYSQVKKPMTPANIHELFPRWPITSIRRAITDLTKLGVLEKTDQRREGEYGQMNYCWRLKTKPITENQMELFK